MDFITFKNIISRELDLKLDSYKLKRVQRRVESLMRRHNVESYSECLHKMRGDIEFRKAFLNHFTINTSEFFRNPDSFDFLDRMVLPKLLAENRKIKIWSAACSIGAEPYSIAILLREKGIPATGFYILATDIDKPVLKIAQKGIYNEQALLRTDKRILQKYFTGPNEGRYQLNDEIIKLVDFQYQDLLKEDFLPGWDLIACRNLFIYLTKEGKDALTKRFTSTLKPGGILFLGNTEFIFDPSPYGLKKIDGSFYEKL